MRWRYKPVRRPEHNERRWTTKFAWKKERVGDSVVWLERFWVEERFFQPRSGSLGWWTETDRQLATYR